MSLRCPLATEEPRAQAALRESRQRWRPNCGERVLAREKILARMPGFWLSLLDSGVCDGNQPNLLSDARDMALRSGKRAERMSRAVPVTI